MKNQIKRASIVLLFLALGALPSIAASATGAANSPERTTLYKTTFVRAAPGKLLELIALYKGRMAVIDASGDERPLWWRHTQGDQWDLMLLLPMGSYTEYYSKERLSRREKAAEASSLSSGEFQKSGSVYVLAGGPLCPGAVDRIRQKNVRGRRLFPY
jgi:hypothetical protein